MHVLYCLIKISVLFNLLFIWISLVAHFYLATCVYKILFFVWFFFLLAVIWDFVFLAKNMIFFSLI